MAEQVEIEQMIKEIESPVVISSETPSPVPGSNLIMKDGEMPVFEDRITFNQYEAIAYRNPEMIGWMAIDMDKMHRNCELLQKGDVQLQWKQYK